MLPLKNLRTTEPLADQSVNRPYKIQKVSEIKVRKYGIEEYTFKAKFNDELQGNKVADVKDDLNQMFEDIMQEVSQNYDPDDKVRLSINHAGLDREMTIHLQPRKNLSAQSIMQR